MNFNELIVFGGGINTDDTPQGVPKGDYRDFSYCRLGYNSGNAFAVETSDGTLVIENSLILPQDQILGATPWIKRAEGPSPRGKSEGGGTEEGREAAEGRDDHPRDWRSHHARHRRLHAARGLHVA